MSTSYNGWPASRDPAAIGVKPFEVAGRSFPAGVKGGSVATVLRYVACQYHTRVESLYFGDIDKDDWGYNYRANVNNPSELSCHSSATAIDVNATQHPNGVRRTHTYAQVKTIRVILAEVDGLVDWGGDFSTPDEMHFEIAGNSTQIAALAKKLSAPYWWTRNIGLGTVGQDVRWTQKRLGRSITGKFNLGDVDALKRFQAKLHLTQSGVVNKPMAFFIGVPA